MIFITVKNCVTLFGAEVPYWMRHRCTCLAKTRTHSQNFGQQPYNAHQIEVFSFFLSILLVTTIFFFLNSTFYFGVLAAFYKFHWTSNVYATLTMGNRFLGVQISIIWVVFAGKTVTLLWQPAKAQDIASECHSSYSHLLLKLTLFPLGLPKDLSWSQKQTFYSWYLSGGGCVLT